MNKNNDLAVIETANKGGRPSKYQPEILDRLLLALADGLTQKQACIASGICENTIRLARLGVVNKLLELEFARKEGITTLRIADANTGSVEERGVEPSAKITLPS